MTTRELDTSNWTLTITSPSFLDQVLVPKGYRLTMGKCHPDGRYSRTYRKVTA